MKGDEGIKGRRGKKGVRGDNGTPGLDGMKGIMGPQGPRGYFGPPGAKGYAGHEGQKGDPGVLGEKGIPGKVGPQGVRGDIGPPGQKGQKGDVGAPGKSSGGSSFLEPKVFVNPGAITIRKGTSAKVRCSASGFPEPNIVWSKTDGTLLTSGVRSDKTGELVFSGAAFKDAGEYLCTVTNIVGQAKKSIRVVVEGKE